MPKASSALLVDEQFGSRILIDAKLKGYQTAYSLEASGESFFQLEYGSDFETHIRKYLPTYLKVLVRLNPVDAEKKENRLQISRLRELSDYLSKIGLKVMFVLLVPPTEMQLKEVNYDRDRYDREIRPGLMVEAMRLLQITNVEVDIWKLEGVDTREDCIKLVNQARSGTSTRGKPRAAVELITLGRGESTEKVNKWLRIAASVPGYIGFAVGRTIFLEPLKAFHEERIDKTTAINLIAEKFKYYCDLWLTSEKNQI